MNLLPELCWPAFKNSFTFLRQAGSCLVAASQWLVLFICLAVAE